MFNHNYVVTVSRAAHISVIALSAVCLYGLLTL
jgi:hypothetical protein